MVAFLKGIPQDVLAKASLRSKAYTRALMHFEAYILENKENIQDHLTFLQVRQQTDGHLNLFLLITCVSAFLFPLDRMILKSKSEYYEVYFLIIIYNVTNKSRII